MTTGLRAETAIRLMCQLHNKSVLLIEKSILPVTQSSAFIAHSIGIIIANLETQALLKEKLPDPIIN
jgi:hypothetical protein